MVKQDPPLKEFDLMRQAEQGLFDLLSRVPGIYIDRAPKYPQLLPATPVPDIRMRVSHNNDTFDLIGEVKSSGQPRFAQSAIFQLRRMLITYNTPTLMVFIAPFISKEVRDLCTREGVSYFDLAGNAHVAFSGVYIEREAADNPFREVRETRSLFTPKAARILRVMIKTLGDSWRVDRLAKAAKVSLGQVSNIGTALAEAGFAEKTGDGIELTNPKGLLDAWRKAYKPPEGTYLSYYTSLHGHAMTTALQRIAPENNTDQGRAVLSGLSAAEWMAPYARSGTTYFYADWKGLPRLESELNLSKAEKGGNILVKILTDDGALDDAFQIANDIWCTSPIQTFLDLQLAGDRGREAAEILREKMIQWY